MTRKQADPDVTRRDDGAYWAAALILALRRGNTSRAAVARKNLRRLGYQIEFKRGEPLQRREARRAR